MLDRSDGWLRVVPDGDGGLHFKWKYTSGKHADCYVYWYSSALEGFARGLAGLWVKMGEVDEGRLKPSPDRYR